MLEVVGVVPVQDPDGDGYYVIWSKNGLQHNVFVHVRDGEPVVEEVERSKARHKFGGHDGNDVADRSEVEVIRRLMADAAVED